MGGISMRKLALTGALLIDGNGGAPVPDSLLLIEGDTIVYAGPRDRAFDGYEELSLAGKTVLPGLIDAHVHLSGVTQYGVEGFILEPEIQKAIVAAEDARKFLHRGFTTVGDISRNGIAIRDMIEAGYLEGPRVVTTGNGFCRTMGHSMSRLLPPELRRSRHPWADEADSPWGLRSAIRERIRENPDAIKIWATGGGIWGLDRKEDTHYTYEEIAAAVEEAGMVHLPVWSHAEGLEGARFSCQAGVWAIIHGQELDEDCLNWMAEKGIFFCPTVQFLEEWFESHPPTEKQEQLAYPGDTVAQRELARVYGNLRKAIDKGIRITVGSDSYCEKELPYGPTALQEMYNLKKAGLTEREIILSATKYGAEMLRVDHLTGTLEAGKRADLLVVEENPLEDIRTLTLENMVFVMRNGRRYAIDGKG